MAKVIDIEPSVVVRGDFKVELLYLGCGDVGQWVDGADESDPIMRYDIFRREDGGEWEFADSEAHYTQIDAFSPVQVRQFAVQWMMDRLYPALEAGDTDAVGAAINEIENTPHALFAQLHASQRAEEEIAGSFGAVEGLSARPSRSPSLSI